MAKTKKQSKQLEQKETLKNVTFRVYTDDYNAIKALANKIGQSVSVYLQCIVTEWAMWRPKANLKEWQKAMSTANTAKEKEDIQKQIDYWQGWIHLEECNKGDDCKVWWEKPFGFGVK